MTLKNYVVRQRSSVLREDQRPDPEQEHFRWQSESFWSDSFDLPSFRSLVFPLQLTTCILELILCSWPTTYHEPPTTALSSRSDAASGVRAGSRVVGSRVS